MLHLWELSSLFLSKWVKNLRQNCDMKGWLKGMHLKIVQCAYPFFFINRSSYLVSVGAPEFVSFRLRDRGSAPDHQPSCAHLLDFHPARAVPDPGDSSREREILHRAAAGGERGAGRLHRRRPAGVRPGQVGGGCGEVRVHRGVPARGGRLRGPLLHALEGRGLPLHEHLRARPGRPRGLPHQSPWHPTSPSWEASRGAPLLSSGGRLQALSSARELQGPRSLGFGSQGAL